MHKFDIAIIGAGPAGLVSASVAAQLGYNVVLFEKADMGGDCLNTGCVPSKALLSAAKRGLDFSEAMQHVKHSIAAIAPHDSVERFTKLGVHVVPHHARFSTPHIIQAGGAQYTARRIIISTGSHGVVPPIPGIEDIPILTNETLFQMAEKPKHLMIIGGGVIGAEMANAFADLGCQVTLFEGAEGILSREDPEAAQVVHKALTHKGVTIQLQAHITQVSQAQGSIHLHTSTGTIEGSHLLLATGRAPNTSGLNLDLARVTYNEKGIQTDTAGRTSQKHIYALGDITGKHAFTHMAAQDATLFIRRVLFGAFWAKEDLTAMPRVTYTMPELAQVGLTEKEAEQSPRYDKTLYVDFSNLDRAITEQDTAGFCKLMITKKGHILGATIVGHRAGELIALFCYMIQNQKRLQSLSGVTWAYPTYADLYSKLLSQHTSPLLKKSTIRCISRAMYRLFG